MELKLEPDPEPRNTKFHKKIARYKSVPDHPNRHYILLECGHFCLVFGKLSHAEGVVLCTDCRDMEEG